MGAMTRVGSALAGLVESLRPRTRRAKPAGGAEGRPALPDTDADWRRIGETEPFWGVLTEDRFRRERMDGDARRAFYASGAQDIAFVLSRIQATVPGFRPRRALDFGCGTGRLTLAMASHTGAVTGIDISPGMVTEARQAAAELGVGNAEFVNGSDHDGTGYDWINSCIVLQHIPPRRGYAILRDLLSRLAPGGVCSIQLCFLRDAVHGGRPVGDGPFRSFDGEATPDGVETDRHPTGTVMMYDYDLNRVFATMLAEDIELFGIAPTNHGGHHGAWLFGRRREMAPPA